MLTVVGEQFFESRARGWAQGSLLKKNCVSTQWVAGASIEVSNPVRSVGNALCHITVIPHRYPSGRWKDPLTCCSCAPATRRVRLSPSASLTAWVRASLKPIAPGAIQPAGFIRSRFMSSANRNSTRCICGLSHGMSSLVPRLQSSILFSRFATARRMKSAQCGKDSAHWGVPDPAAVQGSESEIHLAFADTMRMLNQRISIFASLPIESLSKISLQRHLDEIGTIGHSAEPA